MSVQLDGTNHLNLGTGVNVSGGTQMSISGWVYLDSDVGPNDNRIISKGVGTGANDVVWALRVSQSSDRPQFSVRIGGAAQITSLAGVATLAQNVWHHLVGVYNNGTIEIWSNGVLQNTRAVVAGNLDTNADQTWIGDQPTSDNRPLDGRVTDVRIYNRALLPDDIVSIFNGHGVDGDATDIAYRWPLNEGAPGVVIGAGDIINVGPNALAAGDGVSSPTWSSDEAVHWRRMVQ